MTLTETCNYWQPERKFWKLSEGSRRDFWVEIHGEVVTYRIIKYCPVYVACVPSRINFGKITARTHDTITFDKITKSEAELLNFAAVL